MFALLVRAITGIHARWIGVDPVEPDGRLPQRVYFANHASNLDAPVIWSSLPRPLRKKTRPIAARDYWSRGVIRRYLALKVLNAVLIERVKVTKSSHPLVPMEQALDAGDSLIIFPEGTRLTDENAEPGVFKPGLYHLARKYPGVQFVPVYLENLSRILPKGELILVPLLAAARFGAPVKLEAGESRQAFLDRARAAMLALGDVPEGT
ncbi:1-acyl-sn-glycerol-3-phosphate acyltransferase [bacterium]|nr:MAG: 1-acyl-sn-glycerol-3-phosphate acyltransferase [bacterium]